MTERSHAVGLSTDLYQMTMGASFHALDVNDIATFSLFVRRLPPQRGYLVAAGLDDALDRLLNLQFDQRALDYLRSTGQVRPEFISSLANFRFTGDVWAVPEGRIVFADEPLLEVQAPIIEAQIAETILLNAVHYATLVASKAARCVSAAPGKSLIEFGLRRTPSVDAGLAAARSSFIAGFAGTSNLFAGEQFDIPVSGTVAHSFIEIFPNELDAFRAFSDTFPGDVTLLIDTYDVLQGARNAAIVAKELRAKGRRVRAVRIDSGDLVDLSKRVRSILDAEGLTDVGILASGGLDELDLQRFVDGGAPIDAYGIGTRLGTSADAPSLDMVYKLVEFAELPKLKLSTGKATLVGPKQVWRRVGLDGAFVSDLIARRTEPAPGTEWEPLLEPFMEAGRRTRRDDLRENQRRHQSDTSKMPPGTFNLANFERFPVELSFGLQEAQREATERARLQEDRSVVNASQATDAPKR
ncbi:MAG: nicotinate phosphoribosyltransferase [Nitrolancea sp.]